LARRNESALSDRERLILSLAAEGLTDKEIALRLDIGVATVRTYWDRMRRKLGTINRAQSVAKLLAENDHARGEQLLQTAYAQLAAAEVLPVAIARLSGPVVEANVAFCKLLGYSQEEIESGKVAWSDLAATGLDHEGTDLRLHGSAKPFVKELRHRNGARIRVVLGAARLKEPNDLCVFYVIALDELIGVAGPGDPRRLVSDTRVLLR
jgi:DNA-binding CsgD family transcriptional regulator